MPSYTLEQQQQMIKSNERKNSLEKIEMMRFLEQLIQDEDQQRYQQSLLQDEPGSSMNNYNNSPKSTGNTPTPFNNSILPRRSFSRGESSLPVNRAQRETTLSNIYEDDSLNSLVINFQYRNTNHSIRLMDDERDKLRELIQHDKENANVPPMFMQKHMEQKQSSAKNLKRRFSNISISNVTPEPDELEDKHSLNEIAVEESEASEMHDLDLDLQVFKDVLGGQNNTITPPTSSITSPKLLKDQKIKIKELNNKKLLLEKRIEAKDKEICDLGLKEKTSLKESNIKISKLQKNESLLILQIRKDKDLIKRLIKEVASKDKVNLELAQEIKALKIRADGSQAQKPQASDV